MTELTSERSKGIADYVNPFLAAATMVFKNLLQIELKRGKIAVAETIEPLHEVIICIGVVGNLKADVVYSMRFSVVNKIASVLVPGLSDEQVKSEYKDIMGELANMITGNAMNLLFHKGIELTTPVVLALEDYVPPKKRKSTNLSLNMYSPFGSTQIIVSLG
ncbi:MAG: chemotaxis protein CheX [bacterium]|nr:chemotaxis protein CheX [bacterium]